jgi:hypothetical protein
MLEGEAENQPSRAPGYHDARGAADQSDQHTFDQRTLDEPGARGAQRGKDRDLLALRDRPREHDVGEVRARDE